MGSFANDDSWIFKGLCDDFLRDHKGYFIAPIRVNGSGIESIFSCYSLTLRVKHFSY